MVSNNSYDISKQNSIPLSLEQVDKALSENQPTGIASNKLVSELMFYITPIVGLLAFVGILFYGILPTYMKMSEKISVIDSLKSEIVVLDERIRKLEIIESNINELDNVINKINEIVPEGDTQVARFAENIEITSYNTENLLSSLSTGELVLASERDVESKLKINKIPTSFSIMSNGIDGIDGIRSFFTELYKGRDFFIVEKMDLTLSQGGTVSWQGEISLTKYQFNFEKGYTKQDVYGNITENDQPEKVVVDFLKSKFVDIIISL